MRIIISLVCVVLGVGVAEATPVITDGLVAGYDFSGNADDISGNANHGTVDGATLTFDRFGNPDSAYSFDGGSSVITAGSVLTTNQAAITVSAWFFFDGNSLPNGSTSNIVNQADLNGDSAGFSLHLKEATGGNSVVRFLWNDQIGGRSDVLTSEVQYMQWNHVVGVYDGSVQEIFLNGVLVRSVANEGAITFPINPLRIGHEDGSGPGFLGFIDDVYIYDRALSGSEVNSLFSSVPEPSTFIMLASSLVAFGVNRSGKT